MKANPGYKWWPTTNQPVKARTSTVTNRKKLWAFASDSAKGLPSLGKATKSEGMPQRNFGTAGEIPSLFLRRSSLVLFEGAALESNCKTSFPHCTWCCSADTFHGPN